MKRLASASNNHSTKGCRKSNVYGVQVRPVSNIYSTNCDASWDSLRLCQMRNNSSGVTALLNSYTRFPIPAASEEIHLGHQARTWLDCAEGDPPKEIVYAGKKAKRTLFERNLRLVAHCARKYKHSLNLNAHEFEDAIQNGYLGLNRAIEKFSPDRGYIFSTYAFWWLRQSIIRGDGQRRRVRIPDQALQEYKNLRLAITELREKNIKSTPEIHSEMTGLNEYKTAQRAEIGRIKLISSLDSENRRGMHPVN